MTRILSFDPLSEAEKATGKDYHNDESTSLLGLGLAITHNQRKDSLLKSMGDTSFTNDLQDYQQIIEAEGFVKIIELPFFSESSEKDESYFIYFNTEKGILLSFDTFSGRRSVNGGSFYYNWLPDKNNENWFRLTSSGGFTKDVWVGCHDCREALRLNIRNLANNGKFVTPWVDEPFLWLLHHGDTKNEGYDYKKINEQRIAMLPDFVKEAIGKRKTA
jgi:hypothetical protein